MFIYLNKNSLLTKSTSSSFFLWVTNHDFTSYKQSLLIVVQYKLLWRSTSFHPYGQILSRKGKYPVLRTNTKPHQLIKHAKISHSVVSLVFRESFCGTYRSGLNWGTSKLKYSKTTKAMNCVSLIIFVKNCHLSILLQGVRYFKNLFMS